MAGGVGRSTYLRTLGYFLAALGAFCVIALVAVGLLLLSGASGRSLPSVDLDGEDLAALRHEQADRIDRVRADLESEAEMLHPATEVGRHEACQPGQDNWKIRDEFAYRCTLTTWRAYTFSEDLMTAGRTLVEAAGVADCQDGRARSSWFDERVTWASGDDPKAPAGYSVEDLPAVGLTCDRDLTGPSLTAEGWISLPVEASEASWPYAARADCWLEEGRCTVEQVDLGAGLAAASEADEFAVVIVQSVAYADITWSGDPVSPAP